MRRYKIILLYTKEKYENEEPEPSDEEIRKMHTSSLLRGAA